MSGRTVSERGFIGVSALLFAASAAATVVWCASMSAMGEMPMPGGWTMSMAWAPMCGQSWSVVAASFIGMWAVMMIAMMLPSLMPMLRRYREVVAAGGATRLGWLTATVGAAYFVVWSAAGVAVFALGAALAAVELRFPALARAVPVAMGVVVVIAGGMQFSAWKARHLACCREALACAHVLPARAGTAWRYGLRLGFHCIGCSAGLTAIFVVGGVMDLRAMAVVTAAVTAERVAPAARNVARGIGVVAVGVGLWLVVRAVVSG